MNYLLTLVLIFSSCSNFKVVPSLIERPVSSLQEPLSIGFWNAENLFDLEDDQDKNDDEVFGWFKNYIFRNFNQKFTIYSEPP